MKSLQTLIPDIQTLLKTKGWFTDELAKEFSHAVSSRLQAQYEEATKAPSLRLSKMGPQCPCALWHSVHSADQAQDIPPWAAFSYSYGHIIEAFALTLAKAAGHEVVGEQDEVDLDGVKGHRDCIIDGCLVDVKSSSGRGFQKFKDGSLKENDLFGYLDQLDGYLVASADDPLLKVKDRAWLWVIDKSLGHMVLYEHRLRENSIRERVKSYKQIVARTTSPKCTCGTVADGKSGNVKLDTKASYNLFKFCCFPELRTFIYAGEAPRYLTKVVREPDVLEVDRYGKPIPKLSRVPDRGSVSLQVPQVF